MKSLFNKSGAIYSILSGALLFLCVMGCYVALANEIMQTQRNNLVYLATRLSMVASHKIDGDLHEELVRTGSREVHAKILEPVAQLVMDVSAIEYIYTIKYDKGITRSYVDSMQDSTTKDYLDRKRNGDSIDAYDIGMILMPTNDKMFGIKDGEWWMNYVSKGNVYFSEDFYKDSEGTSITAIAPIKDSTGKVVAGVAVDIDIRTYKEIVEKFYVYLYLIMVFAFVFAMFLSVICYRFIDVTAKINKEKYSNHIDELTNLPNQIYFDNDADKKFKSSKRHDYVLSFISVDIDNMKAHNKDRKVGDEIIKKVASTLRSFLRSDDTVCRTAGDNFMITLEYCNEMGAVACTNRLMKALENLDFTVDGQLIKITASFGIATSMDLDERYFSVVDRANAAMMTAKNMGRNRMCIQPIFV